MKKILVFTIGATMLLSSCGSYTGAGAYTGAQFGSILGSAIGGINGGPRGSDVGTVIGMAGGAIIGGAIGNAADQKAQQQVAEHREAVKQRRAQTGRSVQQSRQDYTGYADSGFDTSNSGDDRIDFDGSDSDAAYGIGSAESSDGYVGTDGTAVEIRNAHFVDSDNNGTISRGELCKVVFEVFNTGSVPVYDAMPAVVEASGNRHVYISPSVRIEKINPGKGVRYTAMIKADGRLKDGTAKICCSVLQGASTISKVVEFNIPTSK